MGRLKQRPETGWFPKQITINWKPEYSYSSSGLGGMNGSLIRARNKNGAVSDRMAKRKDSPNQCEFLSGRAQPSTRQLIHKRRRNEYRIGVKRFGVKPLFYHFRQHNPIKILFPNSRFPPLLSRDEKQYTSHKIIVRVTC